MGATITPANPPDEETADVRVTFWRMVPLRETLRGDRGHGDDLRTGLLQCPLWPSLLDETSAR